MVELPAHHRRSIRLKDYDYTSEGGYFITIVTHERAPLFGEISNGEMRLNDLGIIARDTWRKKNRQCAQTATNGSAPPQCAPTSNCSMTNSSPCPTTSTASYG